MLWFKFLFSFLTKCDLSRFVLIIVMAHSFRFFIDKLDCNDIRQTLTKGEATKYLVTPVAISLGVAGKGVYFSFPDLTALRDTL